MVCVCLFEDINIDSQQIKGVMEIVREKKIIGRNGPNKN